MPAETLEISAVAVSGDGSINNVGIRMAGTFQCPECRQKFVLASANICTANRVFVCELK